MKIVVAFSSEKRSRLTVEIAAQHAKALNAELILLRILPDPEKVGVVAQLISSNMPANTATNQIEEVVNRLRSDGVNASGLVKMGAVAKSIIQNSVELKADMIYVGTQSIKGSQVFLMEKDPIVHYLVDNCPISLCLVRPESNESD